MFSISVSHTIFATHVKKLFIVYRKFKFNRAACFSFFPQLNLATLLTTQSSDKCANKLANAHKARRK